MGRKLSFTGLAGSGGGGGGGGSTGTFGTVYAKATIFGTDDNTLEVLSYSSNLGEVYDLEGKVRSAPIIIEFNDITLLK